MIIAKKDKESLEISLQGCVGDLIPEAGALLNALKKQIEKKIDTEVPEEVFMDLIRLEMAKAKRQDKATKIAKAALEAIERGADRQKTFEDCLEQLKQIGDDDVHGFTATVNEDNLRQLFGLGDKGEVK